MNEFELIRRYFLPLEPAQSAGDGVVLGMGDDCALLTPPPGQWLGMSADTLVENVHFLAGCDPERLGHKALAVNLSDLAAMGATPLWFMLCLTLPDTFANTSRPAWLEGFVRGMSALAAKSSVHLIGGDTTRGPLSISIQITGAVPAGQALRRDAARIGDDIYVSGMLGLGGLGLLARQSGLAEDAVTHEWFSRLEQPQPRLALGLALRGVASACLDVSDGFLQDLGHILEASAVGAELQPESAPLPAFTEVAARLPGRFADPASLRDFCLSAGDDYELCFTAPASQRDAIARISAQLGLPVTRMGQIVATPGLRDALTGSTLQARGYQHFQN